MSQLDQREADREVIESLITDCHILWKQRQEAWDMIKSLREQLKQEPIMSQVVQDLLTKKYYVVHEAEELTEEIAHEIITVAERDLAVVRDFLARHTAEQTTPPTASETPVQTAPADQTTAAPAEQTPAPAAEQPVPSQETVATSDQPAAEQPQVTPAPADQTVTPPVDQVQPAAPATDANAVPAAPTEQTVAPAVDPAQAPAQPAVDTTVIQPLQ